MPNVINKETLMPIGFVVALSMAVFGAYSTILSDLTRLDVQASEISTMRKDYIEHKRQSERYFMAISKSLSRIEGKLDK